MFIQFDSAVRSPWVGTALVDVLVPPVELQFSGTGLYPNTKYTYEVASFLNAASQFPEQRSVVQIFELMTGVTRSSHTYDHKPSYCRKKNAVSRQKINSCNRGGPYI